MIKAESLTKRYGNLTAVDDISFTVQPGEVLGFMGPNGAGKTTTMRMVAGFVQPTTGSAEICGFSVENEPVAAKACIGYLPEGAPSYGEMKTLDFLNFVADIRRLKGDHRRERLDDVIARLHLEHVLEQRIETLSKGFRRRVGLAQAILHEPPVLILDEPTDGLDPNQKHDVRTLINDISRDRVIVISTHILEEVNAVCNRAIIISRGRIVIDETPDDLILRSRFHNAVTIRFERNTDVEAAIDALDRLDDVDHVEKGELSRTVTAFPAAGRLILESVNRVASERGWALEQMQLESGRLDEVFRTVTEEESH